MPRPPIGDHVMSAAERQRRRRERLQQETCEQETLSERYRHLEETAEAFRHALGDYAKLLGKERQRFKDDRAFGIWLAQNEFEDFGRPERDALLTMASEPHLGWWLHETIHLASVEGPLNPREILKVLQARKAQFAK